MILLSAPAEVILARLETRTNNPYGKTSEEREEVLENLQTVEPLLRRSADHEIDTSGALEEVVERALQLATRVCEPTRLEHERESIEAFLERL